MLLVTNYLCHEWRGHCVPLRHYACAFTTQHSQNIATSYHEELQDSGVAILCHERTPHNSFPLNSCTSLCSKGGTRFVGKGMLGILTAYESDGGGIGREEVLPEHGLSDGADLVRPALHAILVCHCSNPAPPSSGPASLES